MTIKVQKFLYQQDVGLPEDFTVNDSPPSSGGTFKTTRYSEKLFYSDAQAELNILIAALASSHDLPNQVFKSESPDFRAVLPTGETVYVEITNAISSREARADNQVSDLSLAMAKWASEDQAAIEKVRGFAVTFLLPEPPPSKVLTNTIEEMRRFILTEDLSAFPEGVAKIPSSYQQLSRYGCRVIVLSRSVNFVQVSRGAMTVKAPWEAADEVREAIDRKRAIASGWPRPLWLIVWISGHYYNPDAMLEDLSIRAIAPFERVYVGGGRDVYLLTEGP